ncbi:MAG: tRNA lysidine(34) synthetase TilS [Gaiellales bacterium]
MTGSRASDVERRGVDPAELRERVERHIRAHGLIAPGGAVTCLVSGGQDSTCLWHALGALGYEVAALHVNHDLRGDESREDARLCVEAFGAQVVDVPGAGLSEAALRDLRYAVCTDRLRATGHTASDQVETIVYRLVSSGAPTGIHVRRADGVVRPLLPVWREETEAYCAAERLPFRRDSSNRDTKRGLVRNEILPLLRRLHPGADRNLLRLLDERPGLPRPVERAVAELLASPVGSRRIDLGGGLVAVREYERMWLEHAPVRLDGPVRWGAWTIEPRVPGLVVRSWRAGDRLAVRGTKLQDLFVDAKIPRSEREAWPLVVLGDAVVVVPGVVAAPGYEEAVVATRSEE